MAGAKGCPACRARGHDTSPRGAGRVTRFESLRTVSPASRPCQGSDPRHGSQLRVPRPPPLPRSEPSRSLPPPVAVLPQCRRDPAAALRAFLNSFGSSPSRQRPPWSTFNSSEPLPEWQELGRPLGSARARHPHPGKIDGVGSGAKTLSASMAQVEAIVILGLLAGATAGLWYAWRRWLQACPHCGWVVRRVHHGWLRCPRCHKQYAGRIRPRSH